MADASSISDDPGTILDSFEGVPLIGSLLEARPLAEFTGERLYQSPYRWTAPRILICDDGSLETGEQVYVRSDRITIGRTKGEITIGHDIAMSATHAEIVREDFGGQHAWVLHDLGSSNGTLARVRRVTLDPNKTILLGSRRYHFESGESAASAAPGGPQPKTVRLDNPTGSSSGGLASLVENMSPQSTGGKRHPFRHFRVTIGLPGFDNDIQLNDPCIAPLHAVVTRDACGAWQLEAQPSLNGVWVRVNSVRLTHGCLIQCGEQRFRILL